MFANNSSFQQHDKKPQAASTLAAGINNFQTSSLTTTLTGMNNLIKSHISNNTTTTTTPNATCDDVNNNISSLLLNSVNENNNNNINNLNFCYNKSNNNNNNTNSPSFDSDIQNLLYQQNSINNNNNKFNLLQQQQQQQQQFQNTLRNQSIQNYLNYVSNKNGSSINSTELAANDVTNSTTNNNSNNKFDVKNYLSLLQQHQQQQQQTMDLNKPQNYFPSFTPSSATSLMNGSTNSKYKLINNNNTPPSTSQQNSSSTQIPVNILQKLQMPLYSKMQQADKLKDLTSLNENQQSIQAALINQINTHQTNKLLSNSISSTFSELDNSVRVSPDGNIKNVPSDMLLNQFGMIGLLMMLSRKEDMSLEDENASMIIGKGEAARSLIQRSMNMFSKQNYPSIYTDLIDESSATNNTNLIHLTSAPLNMPQEYLGINAKLKDKLPEISYLLKTCKEEFLFFLFHICCQDELQMKAAAELTSRKWMYHQEWKVWLKSAAELENNNNISNNNQYYWFDYNNWELHKMTFE